MREARRELLRRRAQLLRLIRRFFEDLGYLEVDTPLLSPFLIPESTLEVFRTRHHPADPREPETELYLIPSPELWMKRLLLEGSGSLFQICKAFRDNEPSSPLHEPEFTILEWYTVGADYLASMDTVEGLFAYLFEHLGIQPVLRRGQRRLDCSRPFLRLSVDEAFRLQLGVPLSALVSRAAITREARRRDLPVAADDRWEDLFHKLFLARVEPELPRDRPLLLYDYPAAVPTLARKRQYSPWVERWELYLDGVELANCYTEETDPGRCRSFFRQQARRWSASRLDRPLLRMLEEGLPLCSGTALGIDRLLMLFLDASSVQEVLPFPLFPA